MKKTTCPSRRRFSHRLLLSGLAFAAVATGVTSALEVPYDYHVELTPENAVLGCFPAAKKPVLTVKSGATVRIDGGGVVAGGGRPGAPDPADPVATTNKFLKDNNIDLTVEQSPALQQTLRVRKETVRMPGIAGGHLLVGPIYVEGAEAGDSLEVRILDVTPRIPFGTTGGSPGRGGLALGSTIGVMTTPGDTGPATTDRPAPDAPRPFSKVTHLDLKRNAGVFDHNIEVPLAPFMGVMATCPADSEGPNRNSTAPGNFGGNLDCKELVAGSTLYLPVFQKGALFYTGDSHAVQGDGEVTGTAIETADVCTLQFILHKGKTLAMPRAETPTD